YDSSVVFGFEVPMRSSLQIRRNFKSTTLVAGGEQRGIATHSGGVDGHHLLGGKSLDIVGTARLRAGARKRAAAERLRADDGADHAAIDVDVSVRKPPDDVVDGGIDAGMDAERESVAVPRNLIEQRIALAAPPAHDVQDWSEHLLPQIPCALEHDDGRRHVGASLRQRLEGVPTEAQ